MNRIYLTFIGIIYLLLVSCEGRTGYYNDNQEEIIDKITSVEWILVYEDNGFSSPIIHDKESVRYRFESNGKGWRKFIGSSVEPPLEDNIEYFRWTFTNDNFAVIYIGGNIERYWLIDKLTYSDLWVYDSYTDPVIYPNEDKCFYKFKAR